MITYKINLQGYLLEIANSDVFGIDLQTQDFRDLNTARKRTISKTCTIFGDDLNNKLFENIWDIKFSSTNSMSVSFNHLKRQECTLLENDDFFMDGAIILKRVCIVRNVIKYDFIFTTSELKKFKDLEHLNLKQLTVFDKYNHVLNHANVLDTWNGNCFVDGENTFVWLDSPNRPNGIGYFYPIGFYGSLTQTGDNTSECTITNKYNATKLIPSFFVREILAEIFNYLQINLDITGFDGDMLKTLMISGDYGQFKKQLEGANILLTSDIMYGNTYIKNIDDPAIVTTLLQGNTRSVGFTDFLRNLGNNIVQNDNGSYVFGNDYIASRRGTLKIKVNIEARITHNLLSYSEHVQNITVYKNGANFSFGWNEQFYNSTVDNIQINRYIEIPVEAGDVIHCTYRYYMNAYYGDITSFKYELIDTFEVLYYFTYKSFRYGDTVKMTDWLPNMLASDFVNGLIKMFNLYIKKIDENNIKITTFDNYYEDYDTQIRLDEYIDVSEETEIVPIPIESDLKQLTINYSQPNDFLNEYYKDKTGKDWGSNDITLDTDIATGKKEIILPFSLIIPNQLEAIGLFIISCIYKWEDNKYDTIEFKPMLFFMNGFEQINTYLIDYDGSDWLETISNNCPICTNNFLSFTDGNDRMNLCYSYPVLTFYNNAALDIETNISIYEKYLESDFNDLINLDAKIVRCHVSPLALNNSNLLQKTFNIDGVIFRCNKITNYNKNFSSVEIELIKRLKITRPYTHVEPVNIPIFAPIEGTSILKNKSYDLDDERAPNIISNELFVDLTKRIFGINGYPLITGIRKEYIGKISQSGTNNPTLSDISKSFNVSFTRSGAGVYTSNIPNTKNCICDIEKNNSDENYVFSKGTQYYTLYTGGVDGKLSNHIIKIIKYS